MVHCWLGLFERKQGMTVDSQRDVEHGTAVLQVLFDIVEQAAAAEHKEKVLVLHATDVVHVETG